MTSLALCLESFMVNLGGLILLMSVVLWLVVFSYVVAAFDYFCWVFISCNKIGRFEMCMVLML